MLIIHIAVMQAVEEVRAAVSSDLSEYVDPGSKRNDSQKNLKNIFEWQKAGLVILCGDQNVQQ